MRANVGEIVRTPNGREFFLAQLQCGAAIAAANGHAPSVGGDVLPTGLTIRDVMQRLQQPKRFKDRRLGT